MSKFVIYEKDGIYRITTEENYNNNFYDPKAIKLISYSDSPVEAAEWACKYQGCKQEDFIFIDEQGNRYTYPSEYTDTLRERIKTRRSWI